MVKYKFSNKLMFALVMQDEELCTTLIERLFPGKKVRSLTFPKDIHITPENTIVTGVLSRSVRLDVLFEGEDEYYDIEMQVETDPDLAKRARYYHTSMDTHFLKRGKPYSDLKPTYVIFICLHDPFDIGEPIYQFERFDRNLQLQLNDETFTIILAIDCPKGKIPKELETFFTYVDSGEVDESDAFVKRIHERVEEVNRDSEVLEIMTIEEEMNVRADYAYKQGAAQEKREIARSMLQEGIAKTVITKITGLSAEEIERL